MQPPSQRSPSHVEGLPTSAMFSDGNGGEYRKSLHAYAPPYAQIVESPTQLAGAPMQIDTWNRAEMNLTGSKFVPGPEPNRGLSEDRSASTRLPRRRCSRRSTWTRTVCYRSTSSPPGGRAGSSQPEVR